MATADSSNTGVGITRNSLNISLEQRYGAWRNDFERQAPLAVDFLGNQHATGFTMKRGPGSASEIRDIARGGDGSSFIYGNENRIPRTVSDFIKTTAAAGPANQIQDEFKARPDIRVTRFTSKGLNYIDGASGFNSTKYWTGGIDPRANIRTS